MLLNYREYGAAGQPVIVLLHGLFGSAANWGGVAKYLSQDYRVLVPELRNHGKSFHADDVSYAAMAGDVLNLLDALGLDRVTLVGHSMGGKVAMTLALQAPDYVAALAVVDISPVTYDHDFDDVFEAFAAVDLTMIKSRADADRLMAEHLAESGVRAFLLQNLQKAEQGWQWRINLDVLRSKYREIASFSDSSGARYDGRAHFIYGELSHYVEAERHAAIRNYFPNAAFCEVSGAGHWVYAEKPQGFKACLDSFLS